NAEGYRDDDAEHDRGDGELECCRKAVKDVAGDRAAVGHRPAEITVHDACQPCQVLDVKRLVEPQVALDRLDILRLECRVVIDARNVVSGRDMHEEKGDQRHADHHGYG